jgi:hypothetical protein
MDKHLAFLIDCPEPGQTMMFPDFYENIKEGLEEKYDEVDRNVIFIDLQWSAALVNSKYKVFKRKAS